MNPRNWQNTITTIAGVLFTALAAFGILTPELENGLTETLTSIIGAIGAIIALIVSFRKDEKDKEKAKA